MRSAIDDDRTTTATRDEGQDLLLICGVVEDQQNSTFEEQISVELGTAVDRPRQGERIHAQSSEKPAQDVNWLSRALAVKAVKVTKELPVGKLVSQLVGDVG